MKFSQYTAGFMIEPPDQQLSELIKFFSMKPGVNALYGCGVPVSRGSIAWLAWINQEEIVLNRSYNA